jgi:hypothetical protein
MFHHRMGHDGVRTRFAAGGALNEKSNAGDFWMREFPQKFELKSSWSPSAGVGVRCNASPNRSTILEEKLNDDVEGDASSVVSEGDDEGGVARLEEVLDTELTLEKRQLCEEPSDPNDDDREDDDGEGDATDASDIAGVTSR